WEHDGAVGQGRGGVEGRRGLAKGGKLFFWGLVLGVGLAGGGGDGSSTSEPTALSPSQPAFPLSFSGEIVRPAPATARIIDPETGEEVVVPLPPGTRVIDGEV